MAVLELKGIRKAFPGVQALDGVDFRLEAGQIHALLGENGAGKSTLIKVLTGVHAPDSGKVLLRGQPVRFASPRAAIEAGVSAVHQERNLVTRFSVGENIMLERLPGRLGLVDYAAVHRGARRWMRELDLEVDPRTPVTALSVAQVQIVEIAKALALEARILLLDEPTASITPHETEVLFGLLRRLRDRGTAIVFVSHKLEEVFDLCDTVTVLRDGRNACAGQPLAGLGRRDVVRWMIGRDEPVRRFAEAPAAGQPVALELRGVATALGHRDVALRVRKGEVVGLYGLVGAGRSELAKAIIGAVPVTAGEVRVNDAPARIRGVAEALERYCIGYVSEDRKQEGLVLIHPVQGNVGITVWRRLAGFLGLLTDGAERRKVAPLVRELEVRTPSLRQPVGKLSGGNQQKVSVAKWLAAEAEILIVDEPTVGIDIKTKTYLHELIVDLARGGKAVLLISSDMPEMVALADRILVMNAFRVVGEIENSHDYAGMSEAIMQFIHDEPSPQAA